MLFKMVDKLPDSYLREIDLPMQKIWAGITPKRLLAKQQEYEEDSRLHLFKKLKMI